MKIYALGFCRDGGLPHPKQIIFAPASVNDLALYKQVWLEISGRTFFGDKIYNDTAFFHNMSQEFRFEMLTPVKAIKGMPDVLENLTVRPTTCIQGRSRR